MMDETKIKVKTLVKELKKTIRYSEKAMKSFENAWNLYIELRKMPDFPENIKRNLTKKELKLFTESGIRELFPLDY